MALSARTPRQVVAQRFLLSPWTAEPHPPSYRSNSHLTQQSAVLRRTNAGSFFNIRFCRVCLYRGNARANTAATSYQLPATSYQQSGSIPIIDPLAAEPRGHDSRLKNLGCRNLHDVAVENHEVGVLAGCDRAH